MGSSLNVYKKNKANTLIWTPVQEHSKPSYFQSRRPPQKDKKYIIYLSFYSRVQTHATRVKCVAVSGSCLVESAMDLRRACTETTSLLNSSPWSAWIVMKSASSDARLALDCYLILSNIASLSQLYCATGLIYIIEYVYFDS